GIGLYLTRLILEKENGNIIVESKLGSGCCFSIFLQNCKSLN
ncbi:sensor histidine kinase, partial [Clostridioides difficile]|nr:sensor histidine kinase [Clostridioides difficile]